MAFTRRFLTTLGIEADKVDEIIQAHTEVTDALKNERDAYKKDAEALPKIQKELEDLKEATKDSDSNKFEEKFKNLQKEFDDYKESVSAKETLESKKKAFTSLLKDAGVSEKRFDSILKVTDFEALELDDKGNFKDAGKVTEGIKKDWSDFIPTTSVKGANPATPPANNGSGTGMTKEQILGIKDGVERRRLIAQNPELFGIAKDND